MYLVKNSFEVKQFFFQFFFQISLKNTKNILHLTLFPKESNNFFIKNHLLYKILKHSFYFS